MPCWNILFVCSRNLWRSPTAERIYCDDPRMAVRSRGLSPKAARCLSTQDLGWADIVFVMEHDHLTRLRSKFRRHLAHQVMQVLDIPDEYQFMDARLVELLQDRVEYFLHQIQEDLTTSME